MTPTLTWKVWGDGTAALYEGNEEGAKAYVVSHPDRAKLYIEDPDGREFEEDVRTGVWRRT
jgi:hypothetical protein